MTVTRTVGQSEYTKTKEDHYGKLLSWHIKVTQRAIQNNRWANPSYLLIDATAGSGILDDGSHGSPLVAIRQLQGMAVPHQAVFVEENQDAYAALDASVTGSADVTKRFTRYQDVIGQLAEHTDGAQLGLLYIDPNGTPDFEALCMFARARPKMEVLISVTATGYKRGGRSDLRLDEWLKRIGKRYWLIRKPYTRWHWTFLFGSDYFGFNKKYQGIDLEPVTSSLGRSWLETASYTTEERLGKAQPPLIGLMPNT